MERENKGRKEERKGGRKEGRKRIPVWPKRKL